jgi:type I restriction enzyme, R subunit
VFVDECHRTQSGKLHEAMKAILPGAMLIGFTGTPLLAKDKKKSIEVFGPYIHTYKYDEAVRDEVVLDLRYEARDIDQSITSQEKIDDWFEVKTRGLSDLAKAQLKQRWGTMQKVFSSQDRLTKIVADILMDMETRDRLKSGRGNALLVSDSVYSACRFFELFQRTDLKGKCAIVTSYRPAPGDIKGEETGEGLTEKLRKYEIYRKMLADHFDEPEETAMNKVEQFEREVKQRFIKEPGQMKLLIVVDKLLTGFDAPPATYLYIDKQMRDHGLFQAICRVNRLDSEDKEYGYIIDYKDLFTVPMPQNTADYLHYFCAADTTDKDALKDNEPKRVALYKATASFARSYANIANEMEAAGFTVEQTRTIRTELEHYTKVMGEVKLTSGDYLDMKMFEPAMRHMIDMYIRADDSRVVLDFEELGLVELIVNNGLREIDKLPKGIRENNELVAETIENNLRKVIIDEQPVNPKYYEEMSVLLDALIKERREEALEYQAYLEKIKELAGRIIQPEQHSEGYPASVSSSGKRALFDNLDKDEGLALKIDEAVRITKKAQWVGHRFKEKEVENAVKEALGPNYQTRLDKVMELLKKQNEYQ